MYETYPKPSANPSKKCGEQESVSTWDAPPKDRYPSQGGAKSTGYDGDKSVTTKLENNGIKVKGNAVSASYPKKAPRKFGTEKNGY